MGALALGDSLVYGEDANMVTVANNTVSGTTVNNVQEALDKIDEKVGNVNNLNTTSTNITNAINEINNKTNEIGDLSTLKTINKGNLVAALNETFIRGVVTFSIPTKSVTEFSTTTTQGLIMTYHPNSSVFDGLYIFTASGDTSKPVVFKPISSWDTSLNITYKCEHGKLSITNNQATFYAMVIGINLHQFTVKTTAL